MILNCVRLITEAYTVNTFAGIDNENKGRCTINWRAFIIPQSACMDEANTMFKAKFPTTNAYIVDEDDAPADSMDEARAK
jgi:hypothetical protein